MRYLATCSSSYSFTSSAGVFSITTTTTSTRTTRSHHDAAIDAQHLAGYVSCFWRCKECHRGGNFLRRPGPAEWDFAMNRIFHLIGQSDSHVGYNKPRRHGING